MIRIAIVEDENEAAAQLEKYLDRYASEKNTALKRFRFISGDEFLARYRGDFDIVLMDIQMPGTDGMTVAGRLRELDPAVILIFITNLAHFAIKGYEVDALDFVVKPVGYGTLAMKLGRAIDKLNLTVKGEISVAIGETVRRVPLSELLYIEVVGHTLVYHTTRGDYKTYDSLKNAEANLHSPSFVRCNSCYLVNLRFVDGVNGYALEIGGGVLQISRARRKEFVSALNKYMGGSL